MPKTKDILLQEFRSKPVAYVLQVLGVVVILLNLWLGTKLYPLARNIDQITREVKAIQTEHEVFREAITTDGEKDIQIMTSLAIINTKLDELKTRIDRIDSRLGKHLGI